MAIRIFSRVADTALVDMLYMGVIHVRLWPVLHHARRIRRMIRNRVFEN